MTMRGPDSVVCVWLHSHVIVQYVIAMALENDLRLHSQTDKNT